MIDIIDELGRVDYLNKYDWPNDTSGNDLYYILRDNSSYPYYKQRH